MPLNFNGGSNAFKPYVRYMASTSSWSKSGDNGAEPFQFTQGVFDLHNIETGWCLFQEGQAPAWAMDDSIERPVSRPEGDGWKRGFKVDIFSTSMFGDDEPVREWATNGAGSTMSLSQLYADFEANEEHKLGKVPVVAFEGAVATEVGRGRTTVPTLKIVKFIDRPAQMQIGSMVDIPAASISQNSQPQSVADEF